MSSLLNAVRAIAKSKNINEDVVIEALKFALLAAYRKEYGMSQNTNVILDKKKGSFDIVAHKKVVEDGNVEDSRNEISLEEVKNIDADYKLNDMAEVIVTPKDFGRIAAQTAKQVTMQKILDLERENYYNKYIQKVNQMVIGTVKRASKENFVVDFGDLETVLPKREQIPGEVFEVNDKIKLCISDVKKYPKGVKVFVSRASQNFVKCLFEREIPEIASGIIKIMNIARDPGKRSKVAVFSQDSEIEAIGSCIGEYGGRINVILSELGEEKIDLVLWHENKEDYIKSALSPAEVKEIKINKNETDALVIVDAEQVSLAIGKNGQNVKLAAKLVGMRLDVKTPEQIQEMNNFEGDEE